MPLSPIQVSRSVSPDCTRAVAEQAGLIDQLLAVTKELASQHHCLAGERHKEVEGQEAALLGKDTEIEGLLHAEAQLREEYEQHLTLEQQQWCLEKDALQKILQEQQGTAHTLEQHLSAQITALQDQLARQCSGQETAMRSSQDTIAALRTANQQLQQQHGKLEQDLQAALAYRHKCIQQKVELQQLRKGACQPQLQPEQGAASGDISNDQQQVLTGRPSQDGIDTPPDLAALVAQLKSERELVKRAYNEEKKKADRYRNAYTQLRDCKQPAQRRSKQRAASGAQSMPQLPQLQCLVRQQGDAVQLATAGQGLNEAAAAPGDPSQGPRLPKPSKTRQGPTEHNRFTAEMDLAAAGLLDQPWEMPAGAASKSCGDRVQPGLSWPQRHKRGLKQQHKSPQQQQQQQQLLTRHLAWHQTPEQQVGSGQARVQDDSTENVSGAGRVHQKSETRAQQLSPGAKEALILAGLLSEDQDATMSDEMGEEVISESRQHQQQQELQQQVSVEDALQPWQARLAGHAEAIQQLDRDSLCRISDPCHQPSKRSRSCPPDSFGAAPLAPAESTDAMHVMQSDDTISQGDETMSSEASDIHSAMQTGHIAQSNTVQREPAPADDSTRLCQATAQVKQLAGSHQASAEPPSSKLVAQHLDSLDMTQPNLTPADQRRRLQVSSAQGSTDPGTAPVRPFPCTSPLRQGAGVGPDLDCNRVAAAGPNSGCPQPDAILAATAIAQPNQRQQQQEIVRKGSGLFGAGKGKAAKWKQRAGVRDTGFGENEQPMLVPPGEAAAQQCWLQQGAGQAAGGPAVLGDTAQRQKTGAGFKYQEVVRRKADRAALEGIQCLDCRNFYEAVGTWGHQGGALPKCGHVPLPGPATAKVQQSSGAPPHPGLQEDASRHRYRFAPPATPEGLWDMGFGDSQDSQQ